MIRKLALALSFVAHPIFVPTLLLAFVFFMPVGYVYYTMNPMGKWFLLGASFVLTVLAPALTVFYLLHTKQIKSIHMEHRQERIIPFTVGLAYNIGLYYVMKQFGISPIISKVLLVAILGITVSILITFFWKISAHMIGSAAFHGAFFGYALLLNNVPLWPMVLLFLWVSAVGAARLFLQAHSPAQVYAGWLLGFVIGFGVLIS